MTVVYTVMFGGRDIDAQSSEVLFIIGALVRFLGRRVAENAVDEADEPNENKERHKRYHGHDRDLS